MNIRLIYVLIFFILVGNSVAAQDTIRIYYDNKWNEIDDKDDAVYYRKAFVDSSNTWVAHDFYKSHKIQMIGAYKSKKLKSKHGHFAYYYENGQVKSEGYYENNKDTGVWNRYYENGQLKSKGAFVNDELSGKWMYWYENGQPKSEGVYKVGEREGEWKYHHENGNIKAKGNYVKNKNEDFWEYWYDSGEKQSRGKFINNEKAETWMYYYKNGAVKSKEKFEKGLIAYTIGYFDNGALNYEGYYQKGERQGLWKYGNYKGRIILKGNCKNGAREGEWVRIFPESEMKITYNNGMVVGKSYGGIIKNR